ncbi:hypothetical protein LIER_28504 [Lithospermum erythrorhizon]|uniref:Uncharacterized protein n=1 Tax=Lithospermum erythrorhizon TaxID=34254 RepID=A0AAV3RFY8_LITER
MKKTWSMQSNNPLFNETQWVITIRETLENEHEEFDQTPVSIYTVPKALMASDPESYLPQHVPIGPYHCFRQEMHEMERYKLAATRRMRQVHLSNNIRIEDVVQKMNDEFESRIRACYHKYLTVSGEVLAWIMVVDSCFLLEFLHICVSSPPKDGRTLNEPSNTLVRDIVRGKLEKNTITRDIMKLENQIPLFVLRKMLEIKFGSVEVADDELYMMLTTFLEQLSPFRDIGKLPENQAITSTHMLGFLYRLALPRPKFRPGKGMIREESKESRRNDVEEDEENQGSKNPGYFRMVLVESWKVVKRLNHGPVKAVKKIVTSRGVVFITKLPWTIMSSIPGLKFLEEPVRSAFESDDEAKLGGEDEDGDNTPLVEEIEIPSVRQLSEAYVNFAPVHQGGISAIKFDVSTRTFYLPVVYLDENSDAIMRNLVAYEQCHATGPVIFTRFTELMNGIIDTEEDARILRENGIIVNRMKTDEDVVKLWNGMRRSLRLTKWKMLDKMIEDVNNYYNQRWKVKLKNFMKKYVFGSWQFLTFLACVVLLLLMGLQAFCSVYNCHRFFPISNDPEQ